MPAVAITDLQDEKGEELVVKIGDVQEANRFAVQAKLRPGHHFAKFVQCAETAGQRDEGIRQFRHQSQITGQGSLRLGQLAEAVGALLEQGLGLGQEDERIRFHGPSVSSSKASRCASW